jgi:uncharacterized membrane protein YphA (DoxX/SURF4 family)
MGQTLTANAGGKPHARKFSFTPYVQLLIISFLLMALFISTGVDKITDTDSFAKAMDKSKLLAPFSAILSYAVPIAEIIIAALLVIPRWKKSQPKGQLTILNRIGLRAAFILLALFTLYTLVVLIAFHDNLPCTCGGVLRGLTWRQHLAFNISFLSLAGRGIYLLRRKKPTN